jgi:sugar phosphate isomerase/epimerase
MKRRFFLQSLAASAVGFSVNDLLAQSFKSKSMGVQLYSIRNAISKNVESALEHLVSLGYDKAEIYGYNGTFFGKTLSEFKTILANTGLKVISSHHVSGLVFKSKGSLTDGWDKAIEDLNQIGAKYMVCSYLFPNERTPEIYSSLPDLLNKSGEKTKAAGIQFAYHNHDFEFEKLGDTLAYDFLINKTSAELVKMELDLYWTNKAGLNPLDYFNKYPSRFALWHVKDMEAGTKAITEVGHGTIDFDKLFAAREKAGLKEWFVEQDVSKGDIFESLTFSHKYLETKNYN